MKRALREEETRRRITEAAVELHRTRGPADTSVTDVAKLAGVSRMTVYNHFPTDVDLFRACSTHWAAENPFPAPATWADIDDPSKRLGGALRELYAWYGLKEDMLGKVFRDLPTLPALAGVMDGLWSGYVEEMVGTLSGGWRVRGARREELLAALRLAVDFETWRAMTASGLPGGRAADLVARMVIGAFPL